MPSVNAPQSPQSPRSAHSHHYIVWRDADWTLDHNPVFQSHSSVSHSTFHGIQPPPQPWNDSNCAPGGGLEMVNSMLMHRPHLWSLLDREVARRLRTIHSRCGDVYTNPMHSYSESYIGQQLYLHMNKNRQSSDHRKDGMHYYTWGVYNDARLLLEHILGILKPGQSRGSLSVPLPGFALELKTQCVVCETTTPRPTLQLLATDCWLKKLRELTNTGMPSTQTIIDMFTGQRNLLEHLPSDRSDLVAELHKFAEGCKVCKCRALLPTKVEGPPPPFLQIRSWATEAIGDLCSTTTLTLADGSVHNYKLVAVMYGGNSKHHQSRTHQCLILCIVL
jgi:hypothetical protein